MSNVLPYRRSQVPEDAQMRTRYQVYRRLLGEEKFQIRECLNQVECPVFKQTLQEFGQCSLEMLRKVAEKVKNFEEFNQCIENSSFQMIKPTQREKELLKETGILKDFKESNNIEESLAFTLATFIIIPQTIQQSVVALAAA